MLRRKRGYTLKLKLLTGTAQRVADGKDARVKHTDDIPCIGLLHDFAVLGHQLLGLGQADFLAALDMVDLHSCLKPAGADTHERNPVPVGLVHIGLDFKHKCREIRAEWVDFPI